MSLTPPTQTAAAEPFDHEYDPDGLTGAAVTLQRIADLIGLRAGRGDPRHGDKDWAARRSDLPPSIRAAMDGELKLLRAQLYSSGLFREIVTEVLQSGAARTDSEYDPDGLTAAAVTLKRIADLIEMRSGRGDPRLGDKDWAARRSDLPPSFRAAMAGELKLLRAQLYSTGLFKEIVNVDLGGGA